MAEDNVVVEQVDRDTLDEIWITALRHQPPKDSADDAMLQILARHRLAAQALKEAEDNVAVAFQPLAKAIDDLIAEYGADRPDHQYQPLMLPMIDVKRIRAAIATQAHEPSADVVTRVAFAIIEGSAGRRAAEHAREFQTANWSDALRSATAAIAVMRPENAWPRVKMSDFQSLFKAIEHGDEDHRQGLYNKLKEWFHYKDAPEICHPSHVTRISDASSFDEVCIYCGATDKLGSWGDLKYPCNG